jgi:hypothetical protein
VHDQSYLSRRVPVNLPPPRVPTTECAIDSGPRADGREPRSLWSIQLAMTGETLFGSELTGLLPAETPEVHAGDSQ